MSEELPVPEQKFMKASNSMMPYITAIIGFAFTFAGIWVSVKKPEVAETKASSEFTQMAIGFAQKASENQELVQENMNLKAELKECKSGKKEDNLYLKVKVLNPLKKKYNGR